MYVAQPLTDGQTGNKRHKGRWPTPARRFNIPLKQELLGKPHCRLGPASPTATPVNNTQSHHPGTPQPDPDAPTQMKCVCGTAARQLHVTSLACRGVARGRGVSCRGRLAGCRGVWGGSLLRGIAWCGARGILPAGRRIGGSSLLRGVLCAWWGCRRVGRVGGGLILGLWWWCHGHLLLCTRLWGRTHQDHSLRQCTTCMSVLEGEWVGLSALCVCLHTRTWIMPGIHPSRHSSKLMSSCVPQPSTMATPTGGRSRAMTTAQQLVMVSACVEQRVRENNSTGDDSLPRIFSVCGLQNEFQD